MFLYSYNKKHTHTHVWGPFFQVQLLDKIVFFMHGGCPPGKLY